VNPASSRHVVIVGAGIVGACCAHALLDRGWRVTLVDSGEPGGSQAASFGNGGWISPASVVPMSTPGLWRRVPGFLADRDGPLTIRPMALPRLAPWLWRFVRAGADAERVRATARSLAELLRDGPERHAALAARAGVPHLVARKGLLYAYPSRADFLAEAFAWKLRRANGVEWEELERGAGAAADRLTPRAPWLAGRYRFGVLVPAGAHCTDPGAYVAALVAWARQRGAQWVAGSVTGWALESRRLVGVRLVGVRLAAGSSWSPGDAPDPTLLRCDRAVLAAGIRSTPLAAALGERIPMASERGYHLVLPWREADPRVQAVDWPVPVMPSDGRMAVTATGAGLRLAGQVELAGPDDPPDPRRVDVLWRHATRLLRDAAWAGFRPGLLAVASATGGGQRPSDLPHWMGHRPSTADGRPVIRAAARCPDVVLAFGHGHVGLAAGPATGERVAMVLSSADDPR
jgi:D-amino-acid dehydrogenase